jgi:hypothetical protein
MPVRGFRNSSKTDSHHQRARRLLLDCSEEQPSASVITSPEALVVPARVGRLEEAQTCSTSRSSRAHWLRRGQQARDAAPRQACECQAAASCTSPRSLVQRR